MLNYNKLDVVIENRGIVADSVTVTSQSSVEPSYLIGHKNTFFSPKGQVSTTIQMSYLLRANGDPNLEIIKRLKTYNFTQNTVRLSIAGLVGTFHLNQFSFDVQPNEPVRASASYISYEPIVGQLQRSEGLFNYEDGNFVNVLHGWATYVTTSGSYLDVPTYNLQYSFNADWRPVPVLGQKQVAEVLFLSAQERLKFERDDFLHVNFSGEIAGSRLLTANSESDVQLKGLVFVWDNANNNTAFDLNLKNAVITSTEFGALASEYGKSSVTIEQSF
jgi:hypothetical protein